jgi:hypothetical protein
LFLASACVGIIDNAGIGEDDAGVVTTGSPTAGTTTSGPGTQAGPTTGPAANTMGIGGSGGAGPASMTTSVTIGSGGFGGDFATGGSGGGSFGGSGGHGPDGGFGGSGGSKPDAGMGGSGGSVVGGATYTQVKAIIQSRCASCHSNFNSYNGLTTFSVGQCGSDKLATPNDPTRSAFLQLVQGQGCGGFLMPRGCSSAPCISATDIQTFTSWINAGAPNN